MDEMDLNPTTELKPEELPQEPTYAPQEPVSVPNEAPAEPFVWTAPQQEPVRKESPFANSPYVRVIPPQPGPQQPPQPPRAPQPPQPPQAPGTEQRKKRSAMPVVATVIAVASAALVLITSLTTGARINSLKKEHERQLSAYSSRLEKLEKELAQANNGIISNRPNQGTNDVPVQAPVADGVLTPAQVYAQCVKSVVAINCKGVAASAFGQVMETASSGSGFVLSADGYIVTNYHVVENTTKIEISLHDGTTYPAEYIGGNEANDIALIKVEAQDLPPVTIGSSTELIVGDQVVAIGNPLGELASTLTVGYVSAKDRIVTSDGAQINMLQTDAAINPGNSGGPLFNMYGEVVGITSAKYSGTTDSGATIEGIGFAIPTDDVMMMLEDLRTFGYITGGYLGVTVSEVSEEAYTLYGLPQGVLVREVMPGSCAEAAGMRAQDIIVNLAGNEVKNLNGLSRALNKCKAGEEVVVTVYRSGSQIELTVILDERPQEEEPEVTEPVNQEQYVPWPGSDFIDDWFGSFFG